MAAQAGIAQARSATLSFTRAQRVTAVSGDTYADYADENLWVEFILPAALHQDSRYYTLDRGGFSKRLAYSFSRVAITRTDSGHEAFNASEIFGVRDLAFTFIPARSAPSPRPINFDGANAAIDGGTFIFKEFWPDINNKFFHQKD